MEAVEAAVGVATRNADDLNAGTGQSLQGFSERQQTSRNDVSESWSVTAAALAQHAPQAVTAVASTADPGLKQTSCPGLPLLHANMTLDCSIT